MSAKRKVLVIGWDAAEWKVIDDLMARGLMPTFKKFLEDGVRARIATLDPPLSPMLWTSMATGKRADKHGILGFVEPDSTTNGIRPVSSRSRKVKAIWNMLNQKGYKSNVVGWWPSNPAEPINGVMVSNFYQQEKRNREIVPMHEWDMHKGTVHPPEWEEPLAKLRVHPHEITGNLIMPFVPRAVELNERKDKRLTIISKMLAHACSIHAASTELMAKTEWDFMVLYHDAVDHFSHGFMKYHPPKMEGIKEEDYDIYKDVVTGIYRFHDMMLARTLDLIDDDTTVMIVSDHGFHSDHLRPRYVPDIPAGPAIEHSPFGVFAIKGPGIIKGQSIYGANILDVTPTLLSLFDLPVGEDMDGKALMQIYETPKKLETIDSWENVTEGETGMLPKDLQEDPYEAAVGLQQLIDLGYIDALEGDAATYRQNCINESSHYLARTYIDAGNYVDALPILEDLHEKKYALERISLDLITSYMRTKQYEKAMEQTEVTREKKLINTHYLDFFLAKIYIAQNKPAQAIKKLTTASTNLPPSIDVGLELGKTYNLLQMYDEANATFREVLNLDSRNAYAHHGLGVSLMRTQKYDEAVDEFLASIQSIYHYPFAHYHLGECLALMSEPQHAVTALQVAVNMVSNLPKAYIWLEDLFRNELNMPEKADQYAAILEKHFLGTINIVSGLPNSGMEEVAQWMQEEGTPLLSDNEDGSFSQVNDLLTDSSFLLQARDKTLMVPARLLPSLPNKYRYNIIIVSRPLDESIALQHKKAEEAGKIPSGVFVAQAAENIQALDDTLKRWLNNEPNLNTLQIEYDKVVTRDAVAWKNIASFVGQ